ncbi:MAG: glycosyltransferase family 2 protein [Candidatus Aenigmarchaeota archaeon]|nr:glycosyltransferase family 2 protein [Candidatus Aenigmarchaeota archaeon]
MVKITVVSPVYNESEVLEELTERTTKTLKKALMNDWEFIIVDDASTDSTHVIMNRLVKKNRNLRYIRHEKRGGQTGCFKTGFDNARGDFIITMDGDLQVTPEDIPLFLAKINDGYDVINGIREHRKHDFWLRLISRFYNLLMLIFFNCPVLDAASNYTAVKRSLVKDLPLRGNDHRYLIPMTVRRGAKKIGEVVIRHCERKKGKSKYKMSRKFLKGGPEIIRVWLRMRMGVYDFPKKPS